jgi:hypothetical protein
MYNKFKEGNDNTNEKGEMMTEQEEMISLQVSRPVIDKTETETDAFETVYPEDEEELVPMPASFSSIQACLDDVIAEALLPDEDNEIETIETIEEPEEKLVMISVRVKESDKKYLKEKAQQLNDDGKTKKVQGIMAEAIEYHRERGDLLTKIDDLQSGLDEEMKFRDEMFTDIAELRQLVEYCKLLKEQNEELRGLLR